MKIIQVKANTIYEGTPKELFEYTEMCNRAAAQNGAANIDWSKLLNKDLPKDNK